VQLLPQQKLLCQLAAVVLLSRHAQVGCLAAHGRLSCRLHDLKLLWQVWRLGWLQAWLQRSVGSRTGRGG